MTSNPKISVITPTIRPESLGIMYECLKEQTFKDFEWLVDINTSGEHDLNKAFNRLIKRAQGELIVFYEDYTKIRPFALQSFWDAYQELPNTCFTAPLGKVSSWDNQEAIKWDWRAWKQAEGQSKYTNCDWNTLELDWGAIPKKALYDIGGFDERLDKWWSMDNVAIGKLLYLKGYQFKCLFVNPALALDHDAHIKHPFRERYNPKEVNDIMDEYTPETKLPYLIL